MKTIALFMIMCSTISGSCLKPHEIGAYNDFYNCMLNGHQEALNKIQEIGQDQINEHGIFIKFICKEKPTIGS
jgi:hypothetical protein